MNENDLRKIFFSEEMKKIRFEYYREAYEQGRFDEVMDRTYKLGRHKEGEDELVSEVDLEIDLEKSF